MTASIANNAVKNGQQMTDRESGNRKEKRTVMLKHPRGPLFVDIWEARRPSDVPPILLIHGWGGSGSYWRSTAQALAETATVYVPDLLGTGRSQPVRQTQNMYDQVDSLKDVLDTLKLDTVQIVGHSMGSAMALLLADARPQQVDRVVLTSMCFFLTEQQVKVYQAVMKFNHLTMRFRAPWMTAVPGLPRLMASRYFYRIPKDREVLLQGLEDYLTLDYDTAVACADNAADETIPAAGARLQVPALLVACREDDVMPVENVDYTAETIPNCEVRWIEQCGHLPMIEKPTEYLDILRGFLRL